MTILNKRYYSVLMTEEEVRLFAEATGDKKTAAGAALIGAGGLGLGLTNKEKLTGRVVRYHNTKNENVKSILQEGIKSSHALDPDNITNRVLRDVSTDKKKGLVYLAKDKSVANGVGAQRAFLEGKLGDFDFLGIKRQEEAFKPKFSKTLKVVLDYDSDIKGKPVIENPELRGMTKSQWIASGHPGAAYDGLSSKGTHIIKGDISPDKIVGGKGYTGLTMKKLVKYAKNNPKRFAKEAAKVALGTAAIATGGTMIYKRMKKKKSEQKQNNKEHE